MTAALSTASGPDPDRGRRVALIRDRLHACSPSDALARLIVGEDIGTLPIREPY